MKFRLLQIIALTLTMVSIVLSVQLYFFVPRVSACPNGCAYSLPACLIKGNINRSTGEKIYHVPNGKYYDKVIINPTLGERWFCSEKEAEQNGFRKAYE